MLSLGWLVAVEDGDNGAGEIQRGAADKEEMKKATVETEKASSLRLQW